MTTHQPSLAIVDLSLTDDANAYDITGLELARSARRLRIPCVIVSAYPSVEAARMALRSTDALAPDFVAKDQGAQSLLYAIDQALRAQPPQPTRPQPGLHMDLDRRLAWRDGQPLQLSRQQYDLLAFLYQHRGTVCTFSVLHLAVYGELVSDEDANGDGRLRRLMARLRVKVETDSHHPLYPVTEQGRGYRLSDEP